jgi:hypothetical protein
MADEGADDMSRSGYSEDYDLGDNSIWLYMGAVRSALRGKRGQAFLRELRDTLEAMPDKRLIAGNLQAPDGAVCAIGAVGRARGVNMDVLDPEDAVDIADTFGIAPALAREIAFENDDDFYLARDETDERRYVRVLNWVRSQIIEPANGA